MQEAEAKEGARIDWEDLLPRLVLYSGDLIKRYNLEDQVSPEDIALETMTRVLRFDPNLSRISNPLAVLMKMARNVLIDNFRYEKASKRRHEEISIWDTELDEIPGNTPELENMELRESLLEAVRGDSQLEKMAKTLLDEPSLRSPELAEKLGIRLVDVYRLKKRLQKRVFELAHAH